MLFSDALRREVSCAPTSALKAVANYGNGRDGLIPLWAGEGNLPTPAFISDASVQALKNGETFYTAQRGIPELRESLARYHARHFGRDFAPDEFIVTTGAMHAILLAIQATAGAGDEVIYLTPEWPNFAAAAGIAGANPVAVPLSLVGSEWRCDIDRVAAAITPRTKAIFVNSPSNPTGWMADGETLMGILDLARKHGLWIIADEIYALFSFSRRRATSFLDIAQPDDRILYVNTFSKNWAMTGWRIGWLQAHSSLARTFENLVEYSTSGIPAFLQRGAIAALDHGDQFVFDQVQQAKKSRDIVCDILGRTGAVKFSLPEGAFYLFFAVDGMKDSYAAAIDIVDKANVGLAPGIGFGEAGEGYLRLCFHRDAGQVEEAADRLARWIASSHVPT